MYGTHKQASNNTNINRHLFRITLLVRFGRGVGTLYRHYNNTLLPRYLPANTRRYRTRPHKNTRALNSKHADTQHKTYPNTRKMTTSKYHPKLTFSTGANQPASSHAFTTDKYTKQVNINTIAKIHTTHAQPVNLFAGEEILDRCGNDPSAGSPTETLLRLHLPLNDKV